jgi:hypothetical protein
MIQGLAPRGPLAHHVLLLGARDGGAARRLYGSGGVAGDAAMEPWIVSDCHCGQASFGRDVGPPSYMLKNLLIIVITIINHSYWSYKPT